MAEMFHYTSCGLRDVYLRNGFAVKDTPYGEAIAIHNVEGLHRVIGLQLVRNKPDLSGEEVRFLRKELDFSQSELAFTLGVSENSIRGWENDRTSIPAPAGKLLRVLYEEYACGESKVKDLVERISQLNRDAYKKEMEFEETQAGWKAAA